MKKLLALLLLPVLAYADYNKVTVNDVSSGVGQFNTLQGTGTAITTYQIPAANTFEFQNTSTIKVDAWILPGAVVNNGSGVLSSLTGSNGQFLGYSGGVLGMYAPTAAAGGSSGQIQYNNSSVIAGASGFTYNSSGGDVINTQSSSIMQELLKLQNTNTGTAAGVTLDIQNSSSGMVLEYTSSAFSGTVLTNGPSGTQGAIFTGGTQPLTFGTNNTTSFYIDGTTQKATFPTQIVSTVTTGTAPFSVSSTTNVANLNASSLSGATFASPGSIGSTTPGSGAFTTLTASSTLGVTGNATFGTGSGTNTATIGGGAVTGSKFYYTQNSSGDNQIGIFASGVAYFGNTTANPIQMYVNNGVVGTWSGTTYTQAGALLSSSSTGGVGYTTGAGGTVTQATSRSTSVTLNTVTGQITGNSSSLATTTAVSFTVTDSAVAATDVIVLNLKSGGSLTTHYSVTGIASGSFTITEYNMSTVTADTTTPVLQYAVVKGSNN